MLRTLLLTVCATACAWTMACSSDGDDGTDDNDGSGTPGENTGEDDLYPLFGLAPEGICAAWCTQYESCRPTLWAELGQTQEECTSGCQETLNNARTNAAAPGRENCPSSIDSLYACQAQTCEDFEAGSNPELGWVNCARIEQQFLDECVL
jgi:hypothetical protein